MALLQCFQPVTHAQSGTPAALPSVTLHVESRLVYVNAVVHDAQGQLVRGLTEKDFKLSDDGRVQHILYFAPHFQQSNTSAPSVLANATASNKQDSGSNLSALNLILFDLLDTASTDQIYARQQMLRFLRNLPPGHQIALFVLSDRLHLLQGFTGKSDLLVAAARLLSPTEMNRTREGAHGAADQDAIAYVESQVGRAPGASGGGVGSSFLGKAINEALEAKDIQDLKIRSALVSSAFLTIAQSLQRYPGRKNLFWLSATFPFGATGYLETLAPDFRAGVTGSGGLEALRALSDSQIAIYPISALGLQSAGIGPESDGLGINLGDTIAAQFNARADLRVTMNAIADQTGGEAIFGTNDIAGALNHALDDGANYYTIAYQPTPSSTAARPHSISLSLPGRHDQLFYRHRYFSGPAGSDRNPGAELEVAMESFAPLSDELGLSATASDAGGETPAAEVHAHLNLSGVSFTTDAQHLRRAQLFVSLTAYSPSIDALKPVSRASALLRFTLDDAEYAQLLASGGLSFSQRIALPLGPHRIRLGLVDIGNDRVGTVDMDVDLTSHKPPTARK